MTTHRDDDRDAYVARLMGYGRKDLLRLCHQSGFKQGALKLSDRQLAEYMWRLFGQKMGKHR